MVSISIETEEQTDIRLRSIISNANFQTYEGYYAFEEFPHTEFNTRVNPNSLALVRDNEVWSQLVRSDDSSKELFVIFSFHFNDGTDNSGFVGWLASLLKKELGTGVFVTCGQNSNRGGIFDYWGCPAALGEKTIQTVRELIQTNV